MKTLKVTIILTAFVLLTILCCMLAHTAFVKDNNAASVEDNNAEINNFKNDIKRTNNIFKVTTTFYDLSFINTIRDDTKLQMEKMNKLNTSDIPGIIGFAKQSSLDSYKAAEEKYVNKNYLSAMNYYLRALGYSIDVETYYLLKTNELSSNDIIQNTRNELMELESQYSKIYKEIVNNNYSMQNIDLQLALENLIYYRLDGIKNNINYLNNSKDVEEEIPTFRSLTNSYPRFLSFIKDKQKSIANENQDDELKKRIKNNVALMISNLEKEIEPLAIPSNPESMSDSHYITDFFIKDSHWLLNQAKDAYNKKLYLSAYELALKADTRLKALAFVKTEDITLKDINDLYKKIVKEYEDIKNEISLSNLGTKWLESRISNIGYTMLSNNSIILNTENINDNKYQKELYRVYLIIFSDIKALSQITKINNS